RPWHDDARRTTSPGHRSCRAPPAAAARASATAADRHHLVAGHDLHALTALGLAQRALVRVEQLPAGPLDVVHALAGEELGDRAGVALRRDAARGEVARRLAVRDAGDVLDEVAHRLGRVGLGVADEAHRTALDP